MKLDRPFKYLLLVALIAISFYVFWARYRWHVVWFDLSFPRPWPWPDQLLMNYRDWLDARNPLPPGYLKIYDEYCRVWHALDLASLFVMFDQYPFDASGPARGLIDIDDDTCQANVSLRHLEWRPTLQQEALQFYHRYLCFFQKKRYQDEIVFKII